MQALRILLFAGGTSVFAVSQLVRPMYLARPEILLEPLAVLMPPGAGRAALLGALTFLTVWLLESVFYVVVLRLPWKKAARNSLDSYVPLTALLAYTLLLLPGMPGLPLLGWWLLLDASPWVLTLIGAALLYRKGASVAAHIGGLPPMRQLACSSLATMFYGIGLLAVLIVLTPERRFSEPYDERWGTGDEPRYVRITASLLHDGDANIANAREHVGRRVTPFRFGSHVLSWTASTFSTIGDVAAVAMGESRGEPESLGGQVIRGKDGGTYYVYLPGFPFLIAPAMALDSIFFPGMLPLVILSCLILGMVTSIVIARLVEPFVGARFDAYLLIVCLSLTPPLFFYNFQVYPEMTAALCLALILKLLLARRLGLGGAVAVGLSAAVLPWLHTRYYPMLGVGLLAMVYQMWREHVSWKVGLWAIVLPVVAVGLQGLYVFHISGSLLPDTLWVVNGYPRGGHFFNREALSGLYYLLLGREEGLLVYAPLYALAVPGAVSLWRRSGFAAVLSIAVFVPYLVIAASHDQGGAGAWAPASRYLVPMTPILALWVAAWLGVPELRRVRWMVFFIGAAASFWIGQGMLAERNFPYDRITFLSSGVVNVSGLLGSVLEPGSFWQRATYPLVLLLILAAVAMWGWKEKPRFDGLATTIVALMLLAASWSETRIPSGAWRSTTPRTSAKRLRPGRTVVSALPSCSVGLPRLRFEGAGGEHAVTVNGHGFAKHLRVPPTGETELEISVEPFVRRRRGEKEEIRVVALNLAPGNTPLTFRAVCR